MPSFKNISTILFIVLGWLVLLPLLFYMLQFAFVAGNPMYFASTQANLTIYDNGQRATGDNYAVEIYLGGKLSQINHAYGGVWPMGSFGESQQVRVYKLSNNYTATHSLDQDVQKIVNEKAPECAKYAGDGSTAPDYCRKLGEVTRESLLRTASKVTRLFDVPARKGILYTAYSMNVDVSKNTIELFPASPAAASFPYWAGPSSIIYYLFAIAPFASLALFVFSFYMILFKHKMIYVSPLIWSLPIFGLSILVWLSTFV